MPRLTLLEKLFLSVSAQDLASARSIAEAIATEEESNDHRTAARRLRQALAQPSVAKQLTVGGFQLEQLLSQIASLPQLSDLQLRPKTRAALQSIAQEWRDRQELAAHGIIRRAKVLFSGPPGCGKSASATALGRETGLPVFVVHIDALVGSYLGETASRVRQLLNWASNVPCVLLVDEIDAIARRRGWASDIAEIDRVVVTLLQELEHTRPAGFLCATTNRYTDIDEALVRRFDETIVIPKPRATELLEYAKLEASRRNMKWSRSIRHLIARTSNYADARKAIESAQRAEFLATRNRKGQRGQKLLPQ